MAADINILGAIKEILGGDFGLDDDELVLEAELALDLGMDSMDLLEFALNLEERFSIEIADSEMRSLTTVADVVALVEKKSKVSA